MASVGHVVIFTPYLFLLFCFFKTVVSYLLLFMGSNSIVFDTCDQIC